MGLHISPLGLTNWRASCCLPGCLHNEEGSTVRATHSKLPEPLLQRGLGRASGLGFRVVHCEFGKARLIGALNSATL